MNKQILLSLCLTLLATAPACRKSKEATTQEKIKTTIELDGVVTEVEKTDKTSQADITDNDRMMIKF
jgi:hypothetical protein